MSPHPGYGMTAAVTAGDYASNPYAAAPPYSTGGYTCAPTGYPVTTGYPVPPGGYSPGAACYSMPPPQHSLGQHDKSPNKDRLVHINFGSLIVERILSEHGAHLR